MNLFARISNNLAADVGLLLFDKMTLANKLRFIAEKYYSIFLNRRNIKYFGYNFKYDNRVAPLILQFYPPEIISLDKYVHFKKLKSVLDVGANIGQWAFTAKSLYPQLNIYSFEPNKVAYSKLEDNSFHFKGWEIYNYAIGKKNQLRTLFYTDNSTIGGSFFKNITGEFLTKSKLKKTNVKVVNLSAKKVEQLGLPSEFDLVKIDVEGAELEVLKSLKNINFRYLIIEVPLSSKREVSVEKIIEIITKDLNKKVELLFVEPIGNLGIVANALLKVY